MDILEKIKGYKNRSRHLGVRRSALTEMITFLVVLSIIDFFFLGGTRFQDVSPHPFWIIILLITVQYGVNEGVICTILCTLFLYVGQLPEQKITESSYEYWFNTTLRPLLWLATTVVLGELSNRQTTKQKELEKELIQVKKEGKVITKAYSHLKEVKEALEVRLAGELKSLLTVFEAVKPLESLNRNHILMASEDVIISILNPNKFSLYALGDTGLEPVLCTGWEEADTYKRRFDKDNELYNEIITNKRIICIINKEDEKFLANEGVVAGPIIDTKSGEIYGMLKIEELGFMDLNMQNIETFKVMCEWIGMSYAKAKRYQVADEENNANTAKKTATKKTRKKRV